MPWRSAAAMTSSPGSAEMTRPSTVSVSVVFVSDNRRLRRREVLVEVRSEATYDRRDRRGGRRAERADRRLLRGPHEAGADVVGHVHQQVDVGATTLTSDDAPEDALEPGRALAARSA